MSVVKTFLFRIGHYLLSLIRSLRKLICCRRKKDMEYVLPMTIGDVTETEAIQNASYENPEFKTQWETWPSLDNSNNLNYPVQKPNSVGDSQTAHAEEDNQDDFFKDMVPQIRKQKKIVVRNSLNENTQEFTSNRLAMDPNRIILSSELGVIEDNPCNWENDEESEEIWDADALIRENKKAEQEKRRAEHQRRKQEKENRKTVKPESLNSRMLSISESKDKHKYS